MPIALISPTTIWERLIRKLTGVTDRHRQALQRIRARVWWFYGDLKAYCRDPTDQRMRQLVTVGTAPCGG